MPALQAREVLKLLKQIGYTQERQKGSHRKLVAAGRLPIGFSFHDSDDVPPHLLRRMLIDRGGLTEAEAAELLWN